MQMLKENSGLLSGSTIKLIACILMAIDHAGLILFPSFMPLRAIGRLAFPLFAYFIAEGCRYTRNRLRHLALIASVGVVYFAFYYFAFGTVFASVFLTFTFSILLIYLADAMKAYMLSEPAFYKPLLCAVGFLAVIGALWVLFESIQFDYGFFGMLAPVAAGIFDVRGTEVPRAISILSSKPFRILWLGICLIPICLDNRHGVINIGAFALPVQYLCLLALPILLLYNGKAGTRKLKYFFYLFYPLHLAVLEGIAFFI